MPLASVGACSPFDSSSTGGKAGSSLAITLVAAASVWEYTTSAGGGQLPSVSGSEFSCPTETSIERSIVPWGSAFCSRLSSGNSDGSGEAFHYGPKSLLHNYRLLAEKH